MQDKKLVVDELLTTYGQTGDGPKVLLLHGWGDNHHTFDALTRSLAGRYNLIAPDLPGFGDSQAPPAAWDLDAYVSFIASFLQKIRGIELAAIIGHSNGGAIAIRGLATRKFSAQKCVLLAASGVRHRKGTKRMGLAAVAKLGKAASAPLPNRLRVRLQQRFYQLAGSDALVAPHLKDTFDKIVRQDVRLDAATIQVPALLLYGSNDESTPPTFGVLYQQLIQNSALEILEDAGHFLHHDQPEVIADKIRDFLA